jgi:transcriptional regulator with XRE-family HTH domain
MEPLGTKLRQKRRHLSMTLDDLATRTGISKPYLSLIETGRVPNPPSDEKLRALERELGFNAGELISQANLQRTPTAVRAMLSELLNGSTETPASTDEPASTDDRLAHLIQQLAGKADGALQLPASAIPIINTVSNGYPRNFRDESFPMTVATDFLACPDVRDKDAFAARIVGDRMTPRFCEGDLVIFSPGLTARSGDDCFIRFIDGHCTIQRVFFEKDETGTTIYRLQPRNIKHRPTNVPTYRVAALYRAVYCCHWVDSSSD